MLEIGKMVLYGNNGVYKIENIVNMEDALGNKREYYVLKNETATSYVPTNSNIYLVPIISKQEAIDLINKIPKLDISSKITANSRENQRLYRSIIQSRNREEIIALIKHLKQCEYIKSLQKKKLSNTEEHFYYQAQKLIFSELSYALNIEIENIPEYIKSKVG